MEVSSARSSRKTACLKTPAAPTFRHDCLAPPPAAKSSASTRRGGDPLKAELLAGDLGRSRGRGDHPERAAIRRPPGHYRWLAEEAVARGAKPTAARQFFLVDPLDGTKEFISRNGEFTVNIALIRDGQPVAGVVYAPAIGRLFWGEASKGAAQARVAGTAAPGGPAAEFHRIATAAARPGAPVRVVASRSHRDSETDQFLASLGDCEIVSAGSSLKFCLVASGEAELYPRFGAPWSGIRPPGMRCSRRWGDRCEPPMGRHCFMARSPGASPIRPSLPRPTRRPDINRL